MDVNVHHYIHLDAQLETIAFSKLDQILEGINKIMADQTTDFATLQTAADDAKQAGLDMEARLDAAIATAQAPNATVSQVTTELQAMKTQFAGFHAAVAGGGMGGGSSSGAATGGTSGGTVGGTSGTTGSGSSGTTSTGNNPAA